MSALQNRDLDITEFIKFTAGGIRIADFSQVQGALVRRYKDVYGRDIDLSMASADGVYTNNLALIINNILQAYKTLYSNLDVNTASGVYLDTLCRLSNVKRKPATQSVAYLTLTASQSTTLETGTVFVDNTGGEWVYNDPDLSFSASETKSGIAVTCSQFGEIVAKAGSIFQTLEVTYFTVSQPEDAVVGSDVESDSDIRARRAQSSGASGVSVLEALVGSLLSLSDIRDVKVYNNNTDSNSTKPLDGTTIGPHDVYIILRKTENASITDDEIGSLIYQKLTPGISTTQTGSSVEEEDGHIVYHTSISSLVYPVDQNVYWKSAVGVTPEITIEITPASYFDFTNTFVEISDAIKNYMNNLSIGTTPTTTDLTIETLASDPTFKGRSTFTVGSITIDGTNQDTFYNYGDFGVVNVSDPDHGVYTITIGGV